MLSEVWIKEMMVKRTTTSSSSKMVNYTSTEVLHIHMMVCCNPPHRHKCTRYYLAQSHHIVASQRASLCQLGVLTHSRNGLRLVNTACEATLRHCTSLRVFKWIRRVAKYQMTSYDVANVLFEHLLLHFDTLYAATALIGGTGRYKRREASDFPQFWFGTGRVRSLTLGALIKNKIHAKWCVFESWLSSENPLEVSTWKVAHLNINKGLSLNSHP